MPSITNKGVFPAVREPTPLSLIDGVAEGSPEELKICRPATWPCNPSRILAVGLSCNFFALTISTDPTRSVCLLALP